MSPTPHRPQWHRPCRSPGSWAAMTRRGSGRGSRNAGGKDDRKAQKCWKKFTIIQTHLTPQTWALKQWRGDLGEPLGPKRWVKLGFDWRPKPATQKIVSKRNFECSNAKFGPILKPILLLVGAIYPKGAGPGAGTFVHFSVRLFFSRVTVRDHAGQLAVSPHI